MSHRECDCVCVCRVSCVSCVTYAIRQRRIQREGGGGGQYILYRKQFSDLWIYMSREKNIKFKLSFSTKYSYIFRRADNYSYFNESQFDMIEKQKLIQNN